MATISLYASQINQMPGLRASVNPSVAAYTPEQDSMARKALSINKSVCDLDEIIDTIRASTQIQERKIASLDALGRRIEQFAENAARIDNAVADLINKRKDEFYKEHSHLKPECEKGNWEKFCDGVASVGDWCAKNWKTALKIFAVVVLVAVSVVLICTGVGGIFAAMAWGALLGAGIGGLSGGILSAINGGSFFEGFVNGAFTGAIGGALGGGITSGLTALVGPATTLLGSIAQGAGIGAISGSLSNMAVTAVSFFIDNGTLDGSLGIIFSSGFSGAIAGGVLGGGLGGLSYKLGPAATTSRDAVASRADELRALPRSQQPRATSAAVDARTGRVYYGDSGSVPGNINRALQARMPEGGTHPWPVGNCAEFNAANTALNSGARIQDLVISTVKVRSGDAFPMCTYCREIFDGITVVSG
ncbi:MAG: hypothetical protein LBD25_01815 [Coriobacteriales bacterium]|jgi:hypothetical protein|nr:hypothetical protein [Coriobacteriales bacterium]